MSAVIRMSRPEEVVAYVPYALGFRPRDSVVLLGMRAGGPGLGLTTRIDLADLADPVAGPCIVAEVGALLERDGCDDAFVVVYTDEPRDTLAGHPTVGPAVAVLRRLTSWAEPPGPWVVGAGTYGCWGSTEQCAPANADATDLDAGWLAAEMVVHGKSVVADRTGLEVPATNDRGRRRAAVRGARHAREGRRAAAAAREKAPRGASFGLVTRPGPDPMDDWREAQWRRWTRLVAAATAGEDVPPAELGHLAVAMEDPHVRDSMLCSLVRPLPPHLPAVTTVITVFDDVMRSGGPVPDPERVEPAATVLRAVVSCLGADGGAHALALLAWLAWWSGDGARADVLAHQALGVRPGTRLAVLVEQSLTARMAPGWVLATLDRRVAGPPIG